MTIPTLPTNSISDQDNRSRLSALGVYDHHGYSASSAVGQNTGPQHRTHEGYLRKRGHLLKQWKERWFVLDSVRHEVRSHLNQFGEASSICLFRCSYAITTAVMIKLQKASSCLPMQWKSYRIQVHFQMHYDDSIVEQLSR